MTGKASDNSRQPLWVRYRTFVSVGLHAGFITLSLLTAFALAYNFKNAFAGLTDGQPGWFVDLFLPLLFLALPIKLLVFLVTRQFRGSWRYVGIYDLVNISFASLGSSCLLIVVYFAVENVWYQVTGTPLIDAVKPRLRQSVFLMDFGLTIAFVSAGRVLVRFYFEEVRPHPRGTDRAKRLLVVGTGDEAEAVLREVRRMPGDPYRVVGLLDDRVYRQHGSIHGIDVLGRTDQIHRIAVQHAIDEVLVALAHATPRQISRLIEQCEGTGVRFRTIPSVSDMIEGRVRVSQIRDVDIADLLGREPVQLDTEQIGRLLTNQRIAVTGAGGSIGSELSRQIARFHPSRLVLIDQAENALFKIDRCLRAEFPELSLATMVADIVDQRRIETILSDERPSIVFHAAAHKHVPMMEHNAGEAVKNNIAGTSRVAEACIRAGVSKMVFISTDKAVNPTSIMGCTKRVAEMYVQGRNAQGRTHFVTVRFGNVLGSDGSVVPIFKDQIARGGPVTVTDPEMKRYFMTIPEAAQLVIQAGTMGRGGEIFMLNMGEPVRIIDLARNMIRLSGLKPDVDIEIAITGIRPGEKRFEELSIDGENVIPTTHPKISVLKHRPEDLEAVRAGIEELLALADASDDAGIRRVLSRIVAEYAPSEDPHERPAAAGVDTEADSDRALRSEGDASDGFPTTPRVSPSGP